MSENDFKDFKDNPEKLIGRKVLYKWVENWITLKGENFKEVIEELSHNGSCFKISNHPNRIFTVKDGLEAGLDILGMNKCILID
jgi:hypothetical protein